MIPIVDARDHIRRGAPARRRRAAAAGAAGLALLAVGLIGCGQAASPTAAVDVAGAVGDGASGDAAAPGAAPTVAEAAPTAGDAAAPAAATTADGGAPPAAALTDTLALDEAVDHGDPTAFAAVLAAQFQLAHADAFRIRQSTTTIQQTLPMTLTFAAPDRYSMVTPGMHAVRIGSQGWFKVGAAWQPDPSVVETLAAAFAPLRDPAVIDRTSRRIADAADLGSSTVNGVDAKHYRYRITDRTATTVFTQTFEVWVGLADGRILVQQVDSEASGVTSRSAQLLEYGPGIAVEGPPGR